MKRKSFLALVVCLLFMFSISSLVLAASAEAQKTYKFLNPAGNPGPIEVQGLSPRLDTIEGKTIYVKVCEAGPQTGPYLYQYLVDNYPNTNWVHIQDNGFGPTMPEDEVLENADALIGGQSW